jgi:5'-3' exonuclease
MTTEWNDLAAIEQQVATKGNNLLLIDSNNLSYRFIRRANYNSYSTEFIRTVQSLAKSYDASRTINCFDFGKSYYRMDMLDSYKGNREDPIDPVEIAKKEEFFAVLNKLPDEMPNEVVKFRGVEADDTIAYLVEKLKDNYDHVWIVTSDKDMIQLVDDNVSIFNLFSRKEITIDSLAEELEITPDEFMLSRIIEGDKGDNIIGIEGIGPKRAQGLAKEYKTLDNLIAALPLKGRAKYIQNLNAGKDRIIRNEKLINLNKNEDAVKTLMNIYGTLGDTDGFKKMKALLEG